MPDLLKLFSTWKKEIIFLVVLSTIVVAVTVFLLPGKYLAITTALPANAAAADKSTVFNNSIQELYTALGTPDDVDRIVGTGQLDTAFLAASRKFDLPAHYHVNEKGDAAFLKAASVLKKDSKVSKSEYGELQVRVWDKDRQLAPQLANYIIEQLATIHQNLQNENNRAIISSLEKSQQTIQAALDSMRVSAATPLYAARQQLLTEQFGQYEKLKGQYQLMLDTNPAALVVVEKARPANWPDKPKKLLVVIIGFMLSIIFAILLALLLERAKRKS